MISFPPDSNPDEVKDDEDRFFQTREDALKALRHDKKYDRYRYESFSSYTEAMKFLVSATESSVNSSVSPPPPSPTLIEQEKTEVWPKRQIENQCSVVSSVESPPLALDSTPEEEAFPVDFGRFDNEEKYFDPCPCGNRPFHPESECLLNTRVFREADIDRTIPCKVCGKDETKRCTKCRSVYYCSKD